MKHLVSFSMVCVLSLAAMGQAIVAPYTLEVLDQPYETLTDATVMESEVWDTPEGWDDPEFVVPVGFEFDMLETTISTLFQEGLGSAFIGFDYSYVYDNLAAIYLLGDLDLADLGASGNADAGTSTIQWTTTGEPGDQTFTLEYTNAGFYDEVFSEGLSEYSHLDLQLRLFESTGVIEIHFGESFLAADAGDWLANYVAAGWHGLVPDYYDYDVGGIFTNINAETMLVGAIGDFAFEAYPFDGFPAAGRLFRYTPLNVGCNDVLACNYDETVNYPDPEECEYPEEPGTDCDGNCLMDADGDGVCDGLEGCTEGGACNYDPQATLDDGSCEFPEEGYDCNGDCVNDTDGDGICDANEVVGCSDPEACNYVDSPTDEVPCIYAEPFYDCDGDCLNDADDDGVCDELEELGCTDPNACNFQWWATEDDGSCYEFLPLTLVGDTLVAVGDTVTITVEGPVTSFNGQFNSGCAFGISLIEMDEFQFVGVVEEGFEGCVLTYIEWDGYGGFCGTEPIEIVLDGSSSVVAEVASRVMAFPNPASTTLTLQVPEAWTSGVDARLVNALGQTVWGQRVSSGTHVIDVSNVADGMHLLMVGDRVERVVIQH